jgi:hypothetical protein
VGFLGWFNERHPRRGTIFSFQLSISVFQLLLLRTLPAMRLLLPGRHHLLTNHQLEALTLATQGDPAGLGLPAAIDAIVWAITSANHANTRRNPLPGHRREAAIEEFASLLDVPSLVYHIDDIGTSDRFADYILKKIEVDSRGQLRLTPQGTVVATAVAEVAGQFARLGFRLLEAVASSPASAGPADGWSFATDMTGA